VTVNLPGAARAQRVAACRHTDGRGDFAVAGPIVSIAAIARRRWLMWQWRRESGLLRRGWNRRDLSRAAAASTTIAVLVMLAA
jgi:hypothetical protein